MNVAFHGLTGLVISKQFTGKYLFEALLFGIMPDIGAFPYQYNKIKNCSKKSFKVFIQDFLKLTHRAKFFGNWDRIIYRLTHSILVLFPVSLLALIVLKEFWLILSLSYLSHLIIDVFTHEKDFSQRPFYPLLDWKFKGKDWHKRHIFLSFWLVLIIIFILQALV